MGIHVPQSLMNVAEKITVKVRVKDLTDRQLKNIAKQMRQGYVSRWSNSATAIITRHLVYGFGVPHIRYSSWGAATHNIPNDHPLWDALVNAVAITKLESDEKSQWYKDELDETVRLATSSHKPSVTRFSMYRFSEEGVKMIDDAMKSYKPEHIPAPAEEYLTKLLNREIELIELDVERGDGTV